MSNSPNQIPFYQIVWRNDYEKLPDVFRARYANRIFSDDVVTVSGMMSVSYSKIYAILAPLFRIMGSLVSCSATDIPVTVRFCSDKKSKKIHFNRSFSFNSQKPHTFNSYLLPVKDNIVVEFMKYNVGWRSRFIYDNNKVKMIHNGYVFKIGKYFIPLPLNWLIGKAYAEEEVVSDKEFKMLLKITHPLFGELYQYHGQFKLVTSL